MKQSILWIMLGILVVVGVVWWTAIASPEIPSEGDGLDYGSEITLVGEVECAPKAGDGPHTLECAFGLASEGNHYQLSMVEGADLDSLQIGNRVEVMGTLVEPAADTTYDIVGVIEVNNITRVDDDTATTTDDSASNIDGWQTYAAADFSLSFPPEEFSLTTPESESPPEVRSNIPPCAAGSSASITGACVHYVGTEFENTNFDSAGVEIHVVEIEDEDRCQTSDTYEGITGELREVTINGIDYSIFSAGSAATNSVAQDVVYRTWQHDRCYEIVSRIAYQNYEVYEPGTIEEFSDDMRSKLGATLVRIVESIRF